MLFMHFINLTWTYTMITATKSGSYKKVDCMERKLLNQNLTMFYLFLLQLV